jgi:hypothetical protein
VATLRAAVEAAFNVLNTVGVALTGAQMAYDLPIMQGCGESVVDALQRSERAIKLEHWLWTQDMKEMTALDLRQEILSRFLSRP